MTPFVKSFIEQNINLIEAEEYDQLMLLWQKKANTIPGFYEDVFFTELIYVLSAAYPNVFADSEYAREAIMRKETHQRMHTQQVNYRKGVVFTASSTIMNIVTKLGLSDDELIDLCDEAAEKLQLGILRRGEYQNT